MSASAQGSGETPGLHVSAAVASDVGCHRDGNEDSGVVVVPGDPTVVADRGVLVVVADGMGGHSAGEIASRLVVETVRRHYYESGREPAMAIREAVEEANRVVFGEAARDARLSGMGTTCTAVAIRGAEAVLAHVGDSRLYLVRRGAIYQLTEDHSAVRDMVARGVISAAEAKGHADRNVLLRAVGTRARVDVTGWPEPLPLEAGDVLVVCTDGLHDLVGDEEIQARVEQTPPRQACDDLVALARERGGFDNITVAVARVGADAGASAGPPVVTRELSGL